MELLSDTDLLGVLMALLPGFLTAEIVALLVLREERKVLDRIIQALIYTFLIQVIWRSLPWSQESTLTGNLLVLAIIATGLGLLLTFLINTGYLHWVLRWMRLTQSASRPNEWYDAFYGKRHYTILHLRDGRRIFGWPRLYPVVPDKGHILLEGAEWLDRPDQSVEITPADFLIDVKDVGFIEFVPPTELEYPDEESQEGQ